MSEPTMAAGPAADVNAGAPAETTAPVGNPTTAPEGDSFNPAWTPVFEKIPKEFHNLIAPHLKEWDQNYQRDVSQVQSRYEPYKEFLENEIAPEQIQQALALSALAETNPRALYDSMAEYYKDEWGQGQQTNPQQAAEQSFTVGDEFDIENHPKFQELRGQLDTVAQFIAQDLQGKQEQERLAAAEKEVDAEVASLKEKYGEFDEDFVFTKAMTGVSMEDAVKAYQTLVQNVRQTPRPGDTAPQVITPGSAIPSTQPNPATMTQKERMALVADIARQQAQAGSAP